VTLTATVTDKDGDHASAGLNIGTNLVFQDDGPTISLAAVAEPTLTVDETVLATDASASFAGSFTSAFGADGAGAVTYALGITGGDGVASGLTDTLTGQAIVLVNNAGVIEGHVGSTVGAPTITGPAANSSVSVDETSAANAGFSVAVGAGFPISATSAGPIITATTSYGADGAGTTAYGISVVGGGTTTLKTAVGDNAISLVQTNATTITGQYTDGSGTHTAFTVVINANGTLTVTENVPLEHNTDGNTAAAYNDTLTLSGLINATVTVTDKDGDSVTSSPVAVGNLVSFFDDGPHAFTPDGVASLNGAQAPVNGNLNVNMGADGLGGFVFNGVEGSNATDDSGHL